MSTVSLTVDYSTGVQKTFFAIPWTTGLTILGAIEAAQAIPPGLTLAGGSDRMGQLINVVIDGLAAKDIHREAAWSFWVNGRPGPERLGTETTFGLGGKTRAKNEVAAGDHILAKLVIAPKPS